MDPDALINLMIATYGKKIVNGTISVQELEEVWVRLQGIHGLTQEHIDRFTSTVGAQLSPENLTILNKQLMDMERKNNAGQVLRNTTLTKSFLIFELEQRYPEIRDVAQSAMNAVLANPNQPHTIQLDLSKIDYLLQYLKNIEQDTDKPSGKEKEWPENKVANDMIKFNIFETFYKKFIKGHGSEIPLLFASRGFKLSPVQENQIKTSYQSKAPEKPLSTSPLSFVQNNQTTRDYENQVFMSAVNFATKLNLDSAAGPANIKRFIDGMDKINIRERLVALKALHEFINNADVLSSESVNRNNAALQEIYIQMKTDYLNSRKTNEVIDAAFNNHPLAQKRSENIPLTLAQAQIQRDAAKEKSVSEQIEKLEKNLRQLEEAIRRNPKQAQHFQIAQDLFGQAIKLQSAVRDRLDNDSKSQAKVTSCIETLKFKFPQLKEPETQQTSRKRGGADLVKPEITSPPSPTAWVSYRPGGKTNR